MILMMKKLLGFCGFTGRRIVPVLFLLTFISDISNAQNNNLEVLTGWMRHTDASNSLYHHLTGEAYQILDAREETVSRLTTKDEWKQRQLQIRNTMWYVLGPFPEKTPLNPRKTGEIKKDGYTIENIIYESLPGFYVTASLFIPDHIQKPAPAILFCSGHSPKV